MLLCGLPVTRWSPSPWTATCCQCTAKLICTSRATVMSVRRVLVMKLATALVAVARHAYACLTVMRCMHTHTPDRSHAQY